jgi:hypothetical protein
MKETPEGYLEYGALDVINYLLGRFKEEYTSERDLYKNAEDAEDPAVRSKLMAKKQELNVSTSTRTHVCDVINMRAIECV